jgi:hypothetical protein
MSPEAIFGPVCALAILTGCVVLMVGVVRIRAGMAGRLPKGAFRVGEAPDVPEDVRVWNRNLMNLLEMPQLFYVVSVALYVTHHVTPHLVKMAWIYVGLRAAHSFIHLTSNRVLVRLVPFALSNFVLLSIWIAFARLLV